MPILPCKTRTMTSGQAFLVHRHLLLTSSHRLTTIPYQEKYGRTWLKEDACSQIIEKKNEKKKQSGKWIGIRSYPNNVPQWITCMKVKFMHAKSEDKKCPGCWVFLYAHLDVSDLLTFLTVFYRRMYLSLVMESKDASVRIDLFGIILAKTWPICQACFQGMGHYDFAKTQCWKCLRKTWPNFKPKKFRRIWLLFQDKKK